MLSKVKQYIKEHNLPMPPCKIVVCVSGGADSIALTDILDRLGYTMICVHCNFNLRGKESDRDEQFVRKFCKERQLELIVKSFDTYQYAIEHKVSIEVAAREQRYTFFETIRHQNNAIAIATAHHKNDQAETIVLNMLRGSGLKGLRGMLPLSKYIMRPLLCMTRDDIEKYCNSRRLTFITDSTNSDTRFRRNKIRHEVLPALQAINPSIVDKLCHDAEYNADYWSIVEKYLQNFEAHHCKFENDILYIDKQALIGENEAVLFTILNRYGFEGRAVRGFWTSLQQTESKRIESPTHIAITDSHHICVVPKTKEQNNIPQYHIDIVPRSVIHDLKPNNTLIAYFDADKIVLPLSIRRIHNGDRFHPLGMKGSKKVSDFMIDNKISPILRSNTFVMCHGDDIVWLIGLRIDNRYAITAHTTRVAIVTIS